MDGNPTSLFGDQEGMTRVKRAAKKGRRMPQRFSRRGPQRERSSRKGPHRAQRRRTQRAPRSRNRMRRF